MLSLIQNLRRPDISFHHNGAIRIAANIVHTLNLSPGDSINIAVSDGEYLLHAVHAADSIGRHHVRCYPTKRGSCNFKAQSVSLCRSLLSAIGISDTHASFLTGEALTLNNITYIPIITKRPL